MPATKRKSRALSLSPRLYHVVVAPLLFAVSGAEHLVPAGPILASRVLLDEPRIYLRLLRWIEGYDPGTPRAIATANVACFRHEPHHLQVHGAQQAAEPPTLEEAGDLSGFIKNLPVEDR